MLCYRTIIFFNLNFYVKTIPQYINNYTLLFVKIMFAKSLHFPKLNILIFIYFTIELYLCQQNATQYYSKRTLTYFKNPRGRPVIYNIDTFRQNLNCNTQLNKTKLNYLKSDVSMLLGFNNSTIGLFFLCGLKNTLESILKRGFIIRQSGVKSLRF